MSVKICICDDASEERASLNALEKVGAALRDGREYL